MNHDKTDQDLTGENPLDPIVRQARLIEPGQLALLADDAWFAGLAERVTATPVPQQAVRPAASGDSPRAGWRRHVPRSVAFGAIAVGAVGLGAGAVAVTQFLQPDGLSVVCVLGVDADSEQVEKRATVADPLAACEREWPAAAEVPELAVFMGKYDSVFVAPRGWDGVPGQDVTEVAQDVAFDPRPARLQAALDDWLDGLPAHCLSNDEAVSRVQDDLARLNMVGWTARSDDNGGQEQPADGVRTCASADIYEAGSREVVVRNFTLGDEVSGQFVLGMDDAEMRAYYTQEHEEAVESGSESELSQEEWVDLNVANTVAVREEREAMREAFASGQCLTVQQAEREAVSLLDPSWNPVVDVSIDNTLPCAIVEAGMGGTWLISIVGPETISDS